MEKRKGEIDIINEVLEECILAYPVSSFIISLYKQYLKYGSMSRKQMEGLLAKASKVPSIPPARLATLEARIKKMPIRFKSEAPEAKPMFEKDEASGKMIDDILKKYPQHKRVLFLKSKYDNNEILSSADVADLKRFSQLLK
jgi:hypothetical protein